MEIRIQCDCSKELQYIKTKIVDNKTVFVCTPCINCLDHEWQGGRDSAREEIKKEKQELKEKIHKAETLKELKQLMTNFWEENNNE